MRKKHDWLVVEPTPFEKYANVKMGVFNPKRDENKRYSSCHHPDDEQSKLAFPHGKDRLPTPNHQFSAMLLSGRVPNPTFKLYTYILG